MPVPNSMADLATLASSNFPTGTESIGNNLDNYLRAIQSILRSTNAVASATIASASTVDLGSADAEYVTVTGASTINSFGPGFPGCRREVKFSGSLTIAASSSIDLPSGANITTAAGDVLSFRCTSSGVWSLSGGWRDIGAVRKSGDTMTGSLSFKDGVNNTRLVLAGGDFFIEPPVGGVVSVRGYTGAGGASLAVHGSISGEQNFISTTGNWVAGTTGAGNMYFRPNGVGSVAGECRITSVGDFLVTGTLISTSDERLKVGWTSVHGDLVDRLARVRSGQYTRTDTGIRQLGVSAQSLRHALPEAVEVGEDGYLSVAYANAALVGVIELSKAIMDIREHIKCSGAA